MSSSPYASASTGQKAREEISRILRGFGCASIGFMDDYEKHEVLLAFTHRGRQVQLRASAKGWAQLFLKAKPWTGQRGLSRVAYEQAALQQGHIAVNSILRDWIRGQVTAIECGVLSFEAVFFSHMITASGQTMLERAADLLPGAEQPKVVMQRGPNEA